LPFGTIDHVTGLQIAAAHAARRYAETGAGRDIRVRSELSLSDIAKAVDVAESTISRWESGQRVPRRSAAAARWAALLGDLERAV
jgi:DNA-binding transcriptional regulator YiaG